MPRRRSSPRLNRAEEKLLDAVGQGDVEKVKRLIKDGLNVNCTDVLKSTPLHKAAYEGHVGVAELLLKAGAQVDSRDKDESTPLHKAASGGHVGVAELLLKAGAQVDSRGGGKITPLHRAASRGHVGVVELLLKAGAQVDSRSKVEFTQLHYAASGGHVGVAELLLKAGAQVDSRDKDDETPKDKAERTDVPYVYSSMGKFNIREGRKMVLELLTSGKVTSPYRQRMDLDGGKLQIMTCTVSVPPGAVTMEREISCKVVDPNYVTFPLKDGEMLVSDIIELCPHWATFWKPVTVQMQYSSTSSGGAMEPVMWVSEDRSQWTELKTTQKNKDKMSVSVNHFSTFAIISQLKQDRFSVSPDGCTLISSTQPDVQITFPEQSVQTQSQVNIQVQEVTKRAIEDMKANHQSFSSVLCASPIVWAETVVGSTVQFHKPVTVRVPQPKHYMDIQHKGPTKLRVMSCEEGADDWIDMTDVINIRATQQYVEFEVSHFTRWLVIVVEDIYDNPEDLGPILQRFCRWLQHHAVQFILLQRDDNKNEFIIECTKAEDAETKRASLISEGYKGPVPSASVLLFEGQTVEVQLLGNVSIAFGLESTMKRRFTFHSQRDNRLHIQVIALESKGQMNVDGKGSAVFFSLPRVKIRSEEKKQALKRKEMRGDSQPPTEEELQKPRKLCELPIYVPHDPPKLTSEGAEHGATLEGVGKYFHFIKEEVSASWRDLAFYLGFNQPDIDNIDGRNSDDKSKCMIMLGEWQKRTGRKATIKVLMEALSNAKLQKVVDDLKEAYPLLRHM